MYPPADKYFVYFRRPMKKIVNELEGLSTKIESINFGILTEQRAKELSVLKISKREIYDINTEKPMVGGVLDPKLGLSSPGELCETCNKTLQECAGHFGHIELTLPVFHPGYQKMLVKILQTICKKCSRILLPEKKIFLYRINSKNIFNDDTLFGEAKKNQTCFYCGYTNGVVKKGIGTKILYSGYDLNPVVVRSLLSQIEDYDLLNFNKKGCNELYDNVCDTSRVDSSFNDTSLQPHLRNDFNLFTNIVVSTVLVPPACSRPSVKTDEFGSNEDDLTIKLSEMVQLSGTIVNSLTTSSLTLLLNDWELLNNTFNSYISGNNLRSLLTRLKGKQGRFRNNLSGKRSDYTARTVISPDPHLSIEQVGIPLQIAKILTVPEKVTEFNIQSLRKCVLNGPKRYPGANFIINKENKRISTWYNKRVLIGDVVERHLIDNDRVLFNRQPSLHRLSILSHFAKIVPNKTFCFNVSVCAPYNADFDGDEMNVHVPQTLFARAECSLMRIKENLRSPKDNQLIIMPNQDFITSVYLIGNEYFDEMSFSTYLFEVCHASKDYEMARKIRPSILRPTRIYTGQQLLGTIFKKHGPFKTLITKKMLKQYLSEMSNEEIVIAENSIARVSVRFIGERGFSIGVDDLEYKNEENKTIGIKTLIREYVEEIDSDNIAELSSVRDKISKTIKLIPDNSALIMAESGSKGSKINITQMVAMVGQQVINGQRVPLSYSGRSLPHYFDEEVNITGLGRTAENEPGDFSRLSTTCSNTSRQMAGICGQTGDQKNENVGDTMNNRFISSSAMDDSLPCTDNLKHVPESEPKAKKIDKKDSDEEKMLFRGFIKNSFFTGLNAFEFFFHAISGREGLVDTAVKTAETGYMQRRLIKALEDLKLCFDGSVRGTDCVIQFPDSNSSYFRKGFQPGDAVGAIAAQSIGEPGTQMTLKTFHFAGVGSMNITLGVPRLKEIINASACSTPVIRISGRRKTLSDMRRLNDLIQPLRIENVIDHVDINISENIYVDFRTKAKYRSLNKTMQERLEKRYKNETFIHNDGVRMYLDVNQDSIYTLNDMKLQVGKVFLRGIGTITGTVFNNVERESIDGAGNKNGVNTGSSFGDEKCKRTRKDSLPVCDDDIEPEFELLAEGTGLQEILGMPNVETALTNDILEIESVLGIEAAQRSIINEIVFTLKSHGIEINVEHITLLADLMCFKGKVNGITRFGIKNFKSSPLMLASFEQTGEHLFDAAANNKCNSISGVSDAIIVGGKIPVGTGDVSIYYDDKQRN